MVHNEWGSGEGNIFVCTHDPVKSFADIKPELTYEELCAIRVAYHELDSDQFTILWPPELKTFKVI